MPLMGVTQLCCPAADQGSESAKYLSSSEFLHRNFVQLILGICFWTEFVCDVRVRRLANVCGCTSSGSNKQLLRGLEAA
jgi:hypothetical protein